MTQAGGCSSGLFPKLRRPVRLPRFPSVGRPVRGQGDDGAGQKSCAGRDVLRLFRSPGKKQVGAAIPGATFRFPQKIPGVPVTGAGFAFSERACEAAPCACFALSFGRAEKARRKESVPGLQLCGERSRSASAARVAGSLRFFVRRFARRRSSARTTPLRAARAQKGVFSESAASCGVCAFSRAAGGLAYSKPRLRR